MDKNELLKEYLETGFSPEQVNKMYENLSVTADIFLRLLSNDVIIMTQAFDDIKTFMDSYLSYCKVNKLQ